MGSTVATAGAPARKLPIIVVPGIMGSRLTDPQTGALVWNPTGVLPSEPGSFAADDERLAQVSRPLIPDETHKFPQVVDRVRVDPIRHYYTIITSFYGNLALGLHYELRRKLAPLGRVPVVYCCGYDWRQDNKESAARLATMVDEAQAECDGERVVLVAHSMGGLVSRHYSRNMGGEAKIAALFLLGSPSLGAIKAYHDIREGLPFFDQVRRILNMSNLGTRNFMRDMQSVYQLLPNFLFCSRINSTWATFDSSKTGFTTPPAVPQPALQFSDVSNNDLFYVDIYTGLRNFAATRARAAVHLGTASQFHSGLIDGGNAYMPPRTISYFCTTEPTAGQLNIRFSGVTQVGAELEVVSSVLQVSPLSGDGTVPEASANPPFVTNPFTETQEFPGVDHVSLSSNSGVIQRVLSSITSMASSL